MPGSCRPPALAVTPHHLVHLAIKARSRLGPGLRRCGSKLATFQIVELDPPTARLDQGKHVPERPAFQITHRAVGLGNDASADVQDDAEVGGNDMHRGHSSRFDRLPKLLSRPAATQKYPRMASLPDRPRAALAVTRHGAHQTVMLALDDAALARVCIGATAVAPKDRSRWLHDIAERLDPLPRRLALARARKARSRARQRQGQRVFKLTANYQLIVGGLIDAGNISERDALDHRNVERVLSRMLMEWGKHWSR